MIPLARLIDIEAPENERRRTPRHDMRLSMEGPNGAVVENLSRAGIAVRTAAPLAVDDSFQIELPVAGVVTAEVVWADGDLFGCELLEPITRAAVSAARLKSPSVTPASAAAALTALREPRHLATLGALGAFVAVAGMFAAALVTAPNSLY